MATFELYLIADKAARKEVKNPFYTLIEDERVIAGIFEDFGMDPETSHIVCGHVPVKMCIRDSYKGRALYDVMERYVRAAFFSHDAEESRRGRDLLWYLWLGEGSPLFAKSKMATFELYLIADKAARKEVKNPFYTLIAVSYTHLADDPGGD